MYGGGHPKIALLKTKFPLPTQPHINDENLNLLIARVVNHLLSNLVWLIIILRAC